MARKIFFNEIEQIIPAQPGWTAVYSDDTSFYVTPVVCWALVSAYGGEKSKVTVGMVANEEATLSIADKQAGFLGYNYPQSGKDWHTRSKEYRNTQKSSEQEMADHDNNSALT